MSEQREERLVWLVLWFISQFVRGIQSWPRPQRPNRAAQTPAIVPPSSSPVFSFCLEKVFFSSFDRFLQHEDGKEKREKEREDLWTRRREKRSRSSKIWTALRGIGRVDRVGVVGDEHKSARSWRSAGVTLGVW